ncbi:uncharacterized protein PGTG_10713 [Puccinia graminis f. sp. tritici CRL 75-36-700-3]|uniref:Uncharacterized protein n=1 Tax=Puccinia graminis f. sp. tritici (strain CRL 75-36-700-3 / race SCCL) TaxID=418459 RepID=E3KJS9_PUCGT|nr:uncharacterized protein PGTG_10713 [Puccinia graminis f. sp. tritici CRL 75-36-700-3]EFP84554.2 hypothetical protein PGTG_10713 [Puccinia graminis f. sp. tritici CRL 75-36-700-3]
MPSEEPIPNLGSSPQSSHSEHEGSHEENITDDGQDVEVSVFFTIYVNMPPRQGRRGMVRVPPRCFKHHKGCSIQLHSRSATLDEVQHKISDILNARCGNLGNMVLADFESESPKITWKVYVSNGASGLFSQRNNMILTPGIFEEWKDEIRHSRRGQAKISIQQPKPSQESTADEEAAVERALQEMHGANGGPNENRDQPGNITESNERQETPPLNDFALSATIRELYNIHR